MRSFTGPRHQRGYVAAIVMAVAAAAEAKAQSDAAKKQDNITAAGIRQNMALQQQATAKVNNTIQQQAKSNPQSSIAAQQKSYLDQLQQNQQQAAQRLLRPGLGDAYNQRAAQDQSNQNQYGSTVSSLMANMDGPGIQRQNEQYNFGNLGNDLGVIGGDANGNAFVTKMQEGTVQPNPWLMGLGAAGSAYTKGMSGAGGG